MAIDFREVSFAFLPHTGREQMLERPLDFRRPVRRAAASISGFISRYDDGDHEVSEHSVRAVVTRIEGTKVFVKVTMLLRDNSGNIDDAHSGAVYVLVIAEVGSRPDPVLASKKKSARKTKAKRATRR